MLRDKHLKENVSERSHTIFESTTKILKADILNVEGISSQPLDVMDMTGNKVLILYQNQLKVFLDNMWFK